MWVLAGRKWRANFACPSNNHSAARVFRNAFHFGSRRARLCPASLGLGKDPSLHCRGASIASERGAAVRSLCPVRSVWAVPSGPSSVSFLQISSQNKTSSWFTAQGGDGSWMGSLEWRSLQKYSFYRSRRKWTFSLLVVFSCSC